MRIHKPLVLVLGLAAAGYSAAWTVIVARVGRLAGESIFAVVGDAAITCFLFALFLLAMRFGFLVEEGIARRNPVMRVAVWISIVVALAAAMLPYYYRP